MTVSAVPDKAIILVTDKRLTPTDGATTRCHSALDPSEEAGLRLDSQEALKYS